MNTFFELMAFLILAVGAFLSFRLRGFQFTHFGKSIKSVFSRGKKAEGVSAFEAMATALGGSIGTANIAGTAGAIVTGGPGAVFWMWIAALFGMATKYCEAVLAVSFRGGAMRYIEAGMGRRFRPLAAAFSASGALASLVGTALVQSNTIALSILGTAQSFGLSHGRTAILIVSGLMTAALTGPVIFGGAKRIGRISGRAVPFMAAAYSAVCLFVIAANAERLLPSLSAIVRSAFGNGAMAGGACGLGIRRAFRTGVARGVYSNEAGVGSAAIAHANTSETDPVKQGMMGIFEVFADTIVTCTMTALVILVSGIGIPYGSVNVSGTSLAESAFASVLGKASPVFLTSVILLFACTSIIGWCLYGETCAASLFGSRAVTPFRIVYLLLTPVGAVISVDTVWRIGECLNYIMALPNLAALVWLSGTVSKETDRYKMFEKKRRRHYNTH